MEIEYKEITFEVAFIIIRGERSSPQRMDDPGSPDIPNEIEIENVSIVRSKFISLILGTTCEEFHEHIENAGKVLDQQEDDIIQELILKQLKEEIEAL